MKTIQNFVCYWKRLSRLCDNTNKFSHRHSTLLEYSQYLYSVWYYTYIYLHLHGIRCWYTCVSLRSLAVFHMAYLNVMWFIEFDIKFYGDRRCLYVYVCVASYKTTMHLLMSSVIFNVPLWRIFTQYDVYMVIYCLHNRSTLKRNLLHTVSSQIHYNTIYHHFRHRAGMVDAMSERWFTKPEENTIWIMRDHSCVRGKQWTVRRIHQINYLFLKKNSLILSNC